MNRHKYPEVYMKRAYHNNYFEGWYYKQIDASKNHLISFIPSVSFSKEGNASYLQVIYQNYQQLITDIKKYPLSAFRASKQSLNVELAESSFSADGFQIDFSGSNLEIKGQLGFSNLSRLEYSLINPNIMGFFSYLPFMQCNHAVISMRHQLSGHLWINGEEIDFTNGTGYLEKDWGTSFPKTYLWLQCNNFNQSDSSLFFSSADIPFLFTNFRGFICNFVCEQKQYRFATYNGSTLKLEIEDKKVFIKLANRQYQLIISAHSAEAKKLLAPLNGLMVNQIKEALKADIELELRDKKSNKLIYKDDSSYAAMEIVE